MKKRIANYYPPGYEWREELLAGAILIGLAFIVSWQYLIRLDRAVQELFFYDFRSAKQVLQTDVTAKSFAELVDGCFMGFLLPLLFFTAMTLWHYFSYWRHSKSIYVMRRLPKRGVVFASCVKGPVLSVVLLALIVLLLFGLYVGLYWLAIPAECMPRLN